MTRSSTRSFSIQIHITVGEAITMLEEVWRSHGFSTVALRFHPFCVDILRNPSAAYQHLEVAPTKSRWREFFLSTCDVDLTGRNQLEFSDRNRNGVHVLLGDIRDGALSESVISGYLSSDSDRLLAASIRKYLKRNMRTGGKRVGPAGENFEDKSHFYSLGAAEAFQNGVKLAPLAGEVMFLPDT